MSWRDDAIDRHLKPALEMIADEIDDFGRIDLAGWSEAGAIGTGFAVYDAKGKAIRIDFSHPLAERDEEIEDRVVAFRRAFSLNGATWASMLARIWDDGTFDIRLDYDNPDTYRLSNVPEIAEKPD